MPNLKQRLENLEKSAGHGPGTHEEFILHCMEHGPSDAGFFRRDRRGHRCLFAGYTK